MNGSSSLDWLYSLAFIVIIAAAQWLDGDDVGLAQKMADEQKAAIKQAQQARWEHQKHILHCHRTAGPGSAPAYTPEGDPICIGKLGHTTKLPADSSVRHRPAGV